MIWVIIGSLIVVMGAISQAPTFMTNWGTGVIAYNTTGLIAMAVGLILVLIGYYKRRKIAR